MTDPKLPILLPSAWPEIDRHLWNEAQQELSKLKNKTQQVVAAGYGTFLRFLSSEQELDPFLPPASRLTPDRARRFAEKLKESGYRAPMVNNKFWALKRALRAMEPRCDISFIDSQGRARGAPSAQRVRTRRLSGPKPRKNPLDLWPEIDRSLWEERFKQHNLLDGPARHSLRPDSIDAVVERYGAWLRFLSSRGQLDHTVKPSERISRSAVRDYVTGRLETGNTSDTIMGLLYSLRSVLAFMEPDVNLHWLTWPNGRSLLSQLPRSKRRKHPVVDSRVLYEWGLQMIKSSETITTKHVSQKALRDGVIVALFAARAPRLTSMSRLRIGANLVPINNIYHVCLEKDDLKAGEPHEYDLPEGLTPGIKRYLAIRSELVREKTHDFLWVSQRGDRLQRESISNIIRDRSKERFGFGFRSHRFRHNLGTSARLHAPNHPQMGSAILNNSPAIFNKHYDLSEVSHSVDLFHKTIKEDRADTRSLAGREFRKRQISSARF